MFSTPLNQRTITLKLKMIDVCDLLLACNALDQSTDDDTKKWEMIRDKLKAILDEFDQKQNLD